MIAVVAHLIIGIAPGLLASRGGDSTASRVEPAAIESRAGWGQQTDSFKLVSKG
ncbi:hypothetical protein SynA1560_01960 [Synechococcus sp. A15-60]|nr:hypothetical protein SynA1560_01960 [Synechococcus sp. A15-60]